MLGVTDSRIRVDVRGSRTYVYCAQTNAAELRRALAGWTPEQLTEAAAAAAPAVFQALARRRERARTREECSDILVQAFEQETEAWRREGRFRRQARRRLTLKVRSAPPAGPWCPTARVRPRSSRGGRSGCGKRSAPGLSAEDRA